LVPRAASETATREERLGRCPAGWYITQVTFTIELEREEDGRWIAEVPELPGVLCYGQDRDEAVAGVQALALRVIAERLENREAPAEFLNVTFQAA
jgi:predicted RNase H-like HicB family nuclease